MKFVITGSLLAALCLSAAPAPSAASTKSGGTATLSQAHSPQYACREPRRHGGWFGSHHRHHGRWGGHDKHWRGKGRHDRGHFDKHPRGHRYGNRSPRRGGHRWHD